MATQQFPISLVVDVSLSSTPVGVSLYNTSNIALFTGDTPSPSFTNGYKIYLQPSDVGTDFGTNSITYAMALAAFSQVPNFLNGNGYLVVIPFTVSETLASAITRTADLVQYFGVMSAQIESQVDMLAAAAVIQALNKIAVFVQVSGASVAGGGSLDLLRTGGFTQSRGLLYVDSSDNALAYQAAYAGRAFSTLFSGSNTTQDMDLKQLATIQPDPGLTNTFRVNALTAGADVYASIQGRPTILASGANMFFDQVYNAQWLEGALQVAGFNYLASTSTKVPQTENGMNGLKGALRSVLNQAVTNQYLAPGTWNSATTFGNQADLISNVAQFGFYLYSSPIATQLQADREARLAPLIQIAGKEAGSINKANIIININP